ncbi:MAG: polyprenyl synthetase family protein [Deltaproteobacteria bacterium]|nr:polyprenyl synthetase family protein [Deltaproteobacteria bacterium]MBW1959902.1 polyprenyl synthetase family protein [Deltaproteobacteria bacterium]MBW1994980.1 polyprenyl synthetase family protein [Deltaproteobacteria bacterium]MBW2150416.1 polyprenyl synthetase family protein [Deltaproteobacteria bacterium]
MSELRKKILHMVNSDLSDIETALMENLNPHLDLVTQTARHILFSGGKRLRPLLMVLCARICGYTQEDAKDFATVFEYLHAATLLHDDLVDGATMRRGTPVAHSIWGNSTTVLVGDFLLARALSISAQTGRPKIIKVISEIAEEMSQGEIHQLMRKGKLDISHSEYLEIITRKTAVLIQGACRVGAILAKASDRMETSLSEYGLNIGIAYQIIDDLLDYTADSTILGKEIGADLKEGKVTLPVIHALSVATPKDRACMEDIIRKQAFSADEFKTIVKMLNDCGAIAYAQQLASEKIEAAKAALSVFPQTNTKDLLSYIADYVVNRNM